MRCRSIANDSIARAIEADYFTSFARRCDLLHAFYFENRLLDGTRSSASAAGIDGPHPRLAGDFNLATHLVAKLVGLADS